MAVHQLPQMHVLKHGAKSEAARTLQAACNRRLRSRGLDAIAVKENGVIDAKTLAAARKVAWALGAQQATYEAITDDGVISVGVQRMIRNPGRRNDAQKNRGKARMSRLRAQRKEQAKKAKSSRRSARCNAVPREGRHARAADRLQRRRDHHRDGDVLGVRAGAVVRHLGGLPRREVRRRQGPALGRRRGARRSRTTPTPATRRTASSRAARAGALPGSLVIIGGPGTHVGMLVAPLSGGRAKTVEGNTSFGPGGSQSNGGCIAARVRSAGEIHGVATMNYPG